MQTLGLDITPQQRHLEKNAAPHLRAILSTVDEIYDAASTFRGTHDTRAEIQKAIAKLAELGESLEAVTDEDVSVKEAEGQIYQRRQFLLDQCRRISNATPHLFTEEEGTRPLRKRIAAKLLSLQTDLRINDLDSEFCETAARDAELVHGWINDILAIDEKLDRWQPNMMLSGCNALAKTLRSPISKTAPPAFEPSTPNAKVQNLMPFVDVVVAAVRSLGLSGHGGRERVEPIIAKAQELREELHSKLFSTVDYLLVRSNVVRIQADLRALDHMPSKLGDNVTYHFFFEESKYAHFCIVDLLKAIPRDEEQPLSTTTKIAKGGLSWAS